MGKSSKSKKSDKETQSPMLKIFKDYMQKEKNDKQKSDGTKEKRKKRKKIPGLNVKLKSQEKHEKSDSSCTTKLKATKYVIAEGSRMIKECVRNVKEGSCVTNQIPSEKRESWWLWGDRSSPCSESQVKKNSTSACSCVSCRLKKVLTNEYTCIGILIFLFIISMMIAWMLVSKTFGAPEPPLPSKPCKAHKPDKHLTKNYQTLKAAPDDDYKRLRFGKDVRRSIWDDSITSTGDTLSALAGYDLNDNSYLNTDKAAQAGQYSSELVSLLNPQMFSDDKLSPEIRNFYKKLMETDAQIKILKKGLYDPTVHVNSKKDSDSMFRLKRSLFHRSKNKTGKKAKAKSEIQKVSELDPDSIFVEGGTKNLPDVKETNNDQLQMNTPNKDKDAKNKSGQIKKSISKVKRFANGSIVPHGYIYKSQQLIVQYQTNTDTEPKFPKCSHLPKKPESLEYEEHHSYGNTKRLDQMLDRLLNEHVAEQFKDQFKKTKYEKPTRLLTVTTNTAPMKAKDRLAPVTNSPTKPSTLPAVTSASSDTSEDAKHKNFPIPQVSKAKKKFFGERRFWSPSRDELGIITKDYPLTGDRMKMKGYRDLEYITVPQYDIVLSNPALVNPSLLRQYYDNSYKGKDELAMSKRLSDKDRMFFETDSGMSKVPKRKLQQTDEQENNKMLGYEDFKEVLSDDSENHDEEQMFFDTDSRMSKVPRRKLQQIDEQEDDEMIGYEDFKEVLSDDSENHDENDRQVDRRRRESMDEQPKDNPLATVKILAPAAGGLYNPNWKGPILYPDELNSMMKRPYYFPTTATKPSTHWVFTIDITNPTMKVMDYIDGELDENKLTNLAQAYSDYGVLNEKSGNVKSVNKDKSDHKIKISTERTEEQERMRRKVRLNITTVITERKPYDEKEKDTSPPQEEPVEDDYSRNLESEGISIKVTPDYCDKHHDDDPSGFLRAISNKISKHITVCNKINMSKSHGSTSTTLLPITPAYDIVLNPTNNLSVKKNKKGKQKENESEYALYPDKSANKKCRLTKSSDYYEIYDDIETNNKFIVPSASEIQNELLKFKVFDDGNHDAVNNSPEPTSTKIRTETEKIRFKREVSIDNSTESLKDDKNFNDTEDILKNDSLVIEPENFSSIMKYENRTKCTNTTGQVVDGGEILAMLSNWFLKLASISEDPANESLKNNVKPKQTNVTNVTAYPLYDSEMVDNIGHRSRVLLSFEEVHANISDNVNVEDTRTQTSASSDLKVNTSLVLINKTLSENNASVDSVKTKRNTHQDPNLVLWDDMYDDEYGLKLDPLDEDKIFGKSSDGMMKKSANWFQEKIKRMTESIKKKSKDSLKKLYIVNKRDTSDGTKSSLEDNIYNTMHKITKRESEIEGVAKKSKNKHSFAAMTAHMKEVCKRAALAVERTRNIRPREDHESQAAQGLMQHLVQLMSDLVDFEVKQRTCLTLPADLKGFLEWLTMPVPTPNDGHKKNVDIVYSQTPSEDIPTDGFIEPGNPAKSGEREEEHADIRSDCLGTLQAVQDLMMEYSSLSEEDKRKMFGVKEYLEDQLDFLNKQIGSYDEVNNIANLYAFPLRIRRNMHLKNPEYLRRRQYRNLNNRHKRRFLKNFSRKHTRTTPNNFESLQVSTESVQKHTLRNTEDLKKQPKSDKVDLIDEADVKELNKREVSFENEKVNKRNLQDVYYKALADAKKLTTVKEYPRDVEFSKAFVNRNSTLT